MARSNQKGRNNNNPEGHNQYSGLTGTFRSHPIASAAAAAAAGAAGLFLWTKRDKISEQANRAGEKLNKWTEDMRSQKNESSSSGRRMSETGTETVGQPNLGTAASSGSNVNRSAGSHSSGGKTGQNFSSSKTAAPEVSA